jgi:hypothetical protein
MAKDSDKTTSTLGAEKAGGKLSGLLADEKEFDRRALWRIGWWATAAVGTLIVAMLVNQGAQSWRQDRISAAELARQAQSLARDSQNEARQLTAAVETLNSDRDRLYARVTVLEQSLDSVTGTLAKRAPPASAGAQSSGRPSAAASPSSSQTATADELQGTAASSPSPMPGSQAAVSGQGAAGLSAADSSVVAPTVTPIATTSAAGNDKTRSDTTRSGGTPGAASQPQPSSAAMSAMAAAPVAPNLPTAMTSASLVAPKSIMGPPDPAATRLTEPDKLAKLDSKTDAKPQDTSPAEANATPTDTAPDAVHKTEFAVDLGSANSISGLRALWRGLVKTNSDLARLRPIIMLKEGNTGLGMQLRLGAGPLSDAAAAAKICASLSESQRPCETTVYDGQRLATRGDENEAKQPAASEQKPAPNTAGAPPTYQRRRAFQQRHGAAREPRAAQPAAAPPPPPPPQQPESKSEPATLSSVFRRQ